MNTMTVHLKKWPVYKIALSLAGLLLLILYSPYALNGGFIKDDWSIYYTAYHKENVWQNFHHWITTVASHRPVYAILLATMPRIFHQNTAAYILVNTTIWILAVFITMRVLNPYLGRRTGIFFFILGMMPVISSVTIFSPVMAISTTMATLLWAISLWCLERYSQNHHKKYYICSYLLLIGGLLTYEVILPLLVITMFLPALRFCKSHPVVSRRDVKTYCIQFIMPIMLIIAGLIWFQKCIAPLYSPGNSRLSISLKLHDLLYPVLWWGKSILFYLPRLVVRSLAYLRIHFLDTWEIVPALGIVILLFFLMRPKTPLRFFSGRSLMSKDILCVAIIFLGFMSCTGLFIFSGNYPAIMGYSNRFMASTALCLSMLLAWIIDQLYRVKLGVLGIMIIFLFTVSMMVQRDNYIQSWALQQDIIHDVFQKTSLLPEQEKMVILGNVPRYVPSQVNDEIVFLAFDDFGCALTIKTKGKVRRGAPLNSGNIALQDDALIIDERWKVTLSENLWYYDYKQQTEESTLTKITGYSHLQHILESL